uniref:Major facilitator superfamily (MFS) profile domain-containing protein n=1 Tax=Bionectria ochroleuca TaxID=29856 RepID=A0A0B7K0E7_BIOOC
MASPEWVQAICLFLGVWVVGIAVAATRGSGAGPTSSILRSKAARILQESRRERVLDLGGRNLQQQARVAGFSFCSGLSADGVIPGKSGYRSKKQIDDASCKLVRDGQYPHGGKHQGNCNFSTTQTSRTTMTGFQMEESRIKHICVSSFPLRIPNPKSPCCIYVYVNPLLSSDTISQGSGGFCLDVGLTDPLPSSKMAAAVDPARRTQVLRVIFVSLLLDLISFTFILPLFPKLLEFYRDREAPATHDGESATLLQWILTGLHRYKAAFSRPIESRYDIVLLGGAMGSLFSLLQAIASPIIGSFSDRYGRRRALLFSMCGNVLSVLLWVAAVDFRTFIASRVIGGLSEGNIQLATAMATDISDETTRGRTMAIIGACFSIAFTFGPALGAWLSSISTFAANPFATAAGFSLALIVLETVYLYFKLPETLPALTGSDTKASRDKKKDSPRSVERTNSHFLLNAIHFVFLLFFSGMESSLSFMTYELFEFSSMKNGRLLGYVGLVSAVLQGGVTRRLPALTSVRAGVLSCLVAFVLLGRISTVGGLYLAATCLAVTSATVVTGLNTLSSFEASEDERGGKLGILRSWGQLGRGLGPILFTSVYWWAGREFAYTLGATGMAVVSAVVLVGLKTPRTAAPAKPAGKGH